jgi:transcriptional regulator with XRE-family HTH domain
MVAQLLNEVIKLKENCPICHGWRQSKDGVLKKKLDCKQTGEIIHCYSHAPAPSGYVQLPDLSAIGQSKYLPVRDREFDHEAHKAQLEAMAKQSEIDRAVFLESLPSLPARDRMIRDRTRGQRLTEERLKNVQKRGLTDDEIRVAIDSSWLINLAAGWGFAITAVDPVTAYIVGGQVCKDEGNPKYDWSLLARRNQLKETGENPLFVWKSHKFNAKKPYEIKYTEGALKSMIRAFFEWRSDHQVIVIGAAGGIFGPKSLERILGCFPKATKHTLLPDADSQNLAKKNIYAGYKALAENVPGIRFADWGQWAKKEKRDPDETYGTQDFNDYTRRSPKLWLDGFGDKNQDGMEYLQQLLASSTPSERGIDQFLSQANRPNKFEYKATENDRNLVSIDQLPPYDPANGKFMVVINPDDDRFLIQKRIIELGYSNISVDASQTGTGKTHRLLEYAKGQSQKLLILLSSHRNPDVKRLAWFADPMPTRHLGMYTWKDGTFHRQPEPGSLEFDREEANCHKTDEFFDAEAMGRNLDLDHPCHTCIFHEKCKTEVGAGHGFLAQRSAIAKRDKIRAHVSQMLSMSGHFLRDRAVIVDEAMQHLGETKKMSIPLSRLRAQIDFLGYTEGGSMENHTILQSVLMLLVAAITDTVNKKFGINHEAIMLAKTKLGVEIDRSLVSWAKGLLLARHTETNRIDWNYSTKLHKMAEEGQFIGFHPVGDLLAILAGEKGGLSMTYDPQLQEYVVNVTVADRSTANMLKKAQSVLLMDATPHYDYLATVLDIAPESIVAMKVPDPDIGNLRIVNVHAPFVKSNTLGVEGKRIAEGCVNHIKFFHESKGHKCSVLSRKVGGIDHRDGWWGKHHRGSNDFAGDDCFIAVGLPNPNIGEVQCIYRAIYGNLDGFDEFYSYLIATEVVQCVGRQRAHRTNKECYFYLIATDCDLSFLTALGYRIEDISSFDISPELGDPVLYRRHQMSLIAKEMLDQGIKLTQANLAEKLGVTQSAVSQVMNGFEAGWKGFKGLLACLNNTLSPGLYFDEKNIGLAETTTWQAPDVLGTSKTILMLWELLERKSEDLWEFIKKNTMPWELPRVIAAILVIFRISSKENPPE